MGVRTVEISTDVYAAIWADRKPGEESENDIIARKFKVEIAPKKETRRQGWVDTRQGVTLYSGEEIFRVYKGKEYRAKAENGFLVRLDTGTKCNSLNQLSRNIGAGIENAWQNWYIPGPDGKRQLITNRRTGGVNRG
jgi:hypothetical protein